MFDKLFKNNGPLLSGKDFSKLSAGFVRSLGETFSSREALRLWPLSNNRDAILRKFWDAAAADFGPQAAAHQPDRLSVEMMREGEHLMGLLLLPTMRGSVGFSAGLWLFGPLASGAADPYGEATARFFAMAEETEVASEAQIYEVKDGELVESGKLAQADISLFLDTLVERHLSGQVVARVKKGDPDMAGAMEAATAQVPYFISIIENYPAVEHYSVKIRVEDGGEVEYFWLENTRWEAGLFHGQVGNDPSVVKTVAYGQPVTIPPDGVCDWYYMWEGKMRGNYTLRAGLPYMDPGQAAKLVAILDEQ